MVLLKILFFTLIVILFVVLIAIIGFLCMVKFTAPVNKSDVDFYGKIVDQFDDPVANAEIEVLTKYIDKYKCSDIFKGFGLSGGGLAAAFGAGGSTRKFKKTIIADELGRFYVPRTKGYFLGIETVSASGYTFDSKHIRCRVKECSEGADTSLKNPYVLSGWKINSNTENVLKWKLSGNGKLIPDGRMYTSNIVLSDEEQIFTEGSGKDISISIDRVTDPEIPAMGVYYKIVIHVKSGGLLECTDIYTYLAPEIGYEASKILKTEKIEHNHASWKSGQVQKKYYIKLNDGQIFGYFSLNVKTTSLQEVSRVYITINGKLNTADRRELLSTEQIEINANRIKSRYE